MVACNPFVGVNGYPNEPVPVIAPQAKSPLEFVVTAFEPEHAPKRPIVVVPVLLTLKSVVVEFAVEEPIANRILLVSPLLACTESRAKGDVEPTPNCPEEGVKSVAILFEPNRIFWIFNWPFALLTGADTSYPMRMF